jgi:uncharacterized membrane protein (UPF0127 family)
MTAKHVLTTPFEQARGVIGRYPDPGERYIFEFDDIKRRTVHMIGVRRPLQVTFEADGEVVRETVLSPWIGLARARCDRVIEQRPEEVTG